MRKSILLNSVIGDILRRRRVALGLSPRSMKVLAGIEPCDLARYEEGLRSIPKKRFAQICQALSIEPGDLPPLATADEATGSLLTDRQIFDGRHLVR